MVSSTGGSLIWYAVAAFLVLVFTLLCKFFYRKELRYRAKQISPKTREPVVPEWLKTQGPTAKLLLPRVMIQTRPYIAEWKTVNGASTERKMEVIDWTQSLITEKIGRVITVPKDACTVSIPMKGFRNGSKPTDFHPVSGEGSGSHYTYHMIGDNKIQVTSYMEGGVAYTAGYCIYIQSPYEKRIHFRRPILEGLYSGPQYFALSVMDCRDPDQLSKDVLEDLKLTFCSKMKKPVMIGRYDGQTKHFEWCVASEAFKMTECSSCKMKIEDDSPPAYSSLNFMKV